MLVNPRSVFVVKHQYFALACFAERVPPCGRKAVGVRITVPWDCGFCSVELEVYRSWKKRKTRSILLRTLFVMPRVIWATLPTRFLPRDMAHSLGEFKKSFLNNVRQLVEKDIEWVDARVAGWGSVTRGMETRLCARRLNRHRRSGTGKLKRRLTNI